MNTSRPRDFADTLPDSVEGIDEGHPKKPTVESAEAPYDRAAIIGRDGRVAAGWALRFIVIVAALALAGYLLRYVWVGLLPVLLAILVSTVLWPVTRKMRNIGLPASLSAMGTILGFFLIVGGIFAAMAPTIATQSREIADQAVRGAEKLAAFLQDNPFGIDTQKFNIDKLVQDATNFLQQQSQNIATGVFTGLSAASSFLVTFAIMLVITFFILKDGDKFLPMIRRYAGPNAGWHLSEVLSRTWNTLSGYIRAQAAVSFIDAILIGIGLIVLGVPLAFVLAVLTFFAGFIPIVGAVSAGAIAVLVALVTKGVTTALIVLGIIIAVQQIEGNVLSPLLQSKAMNLHAAIVLLAVAVGSTLFGIIGAFLAVPVAATIAVWIRYHSEMVALRAGEITVDDIEIATAKGQTLSSREAFIAVRDHFKQLGVRKAKSGSTAASKVHKDDVAAEAVDSDKVQDPHGPTHGDEWLDDVQTSHKADKK
ncbi:AI-2E family transporter [Corynebacterium tapiri]|uniref:AI-2E family transporter n=1 Tax=Corynebacterium tapiri TaxID=1448266 RepID=A0A5C4U1X8_9CORY|nr:AI-2E family transporter [Corynebacterium tapiri]TNL95711.1 AI-2E family transporter [Corynebacterium tapiri]